MDRGFINRFKEWLEEASSEEITKRISWDLEEIIDIKIGSGELRINNGGHIDFFHEFFDIIFEDLEVDKAINFLEQLVGELSQALEILKRIKSLEEV